MLGHVPTKDHEFNICQGIIPYKISGFLCKLKNCWPTSSSVHQNCVHRNAVHTTKFPLHISVTLTHCKINESYSAQ